MPKLQGTAGGSRPRTGIWRMGLGGPASVPGCRGTCKDPTVLGEALDNNRTTDGNSGMPCPAPGEEQLLH